MTDTPTPISATDIGERITATRSDIAATPTRAVSLRQLATWSKVAADAGNEIDRLRAVIEAQERTIADLESGLDQALAERDNAQDWADKLAYSIAPVGEIGEHSSCNNPWSEAIGALGAQRGATERTIADLTAERAAARQHAEHYRTLTCDAVGGWVPLPWEATS